MNYKGESNINKRALCGKSGAKTFAALDACKRDYRRRCIHYLYEREQSRSNHDKHERGSCFSHITLLENENVRPAEVQR